MRPALAAYLRSMAPLFDEAAGLPASTWKGPGYHTRVPAGTRVHEIRIAIGFTLALQLAGTAEAPGAEVLRDDVTLTLRAPVSGPSTQNPGFLSVTAPFKPEPL